MSSQPVTHIVFFRFDSDASDDLKRKTCQDFVSLRESCVDTDGKQYIGSIQAGKDMSIEGVTKGFSHAFVVSFKSVQDRDYYINQDPIHAAFAKVCVTGLVRT